MTVHDKNKNIKKFFYAVLFDSSGGRTFCSFMKNLKSDESEFDNAVLKLAGTIEPFKNLFDVFVSVPKYGNDPSETDYSAKIAEKLSSGLNIPFEKNAVVKIKDTRKLKTIPVNERFSEINSAFKINGGFDRRVCIVDDVYSSGATMSEIIKTFKEKGVTDIYVAALVVQSKENL